VDVAQAIAAGLTVTEISQSRDRSVATVRNQLRSALEKTGSRRQIDLVLLLRSFNAVG
jgi:DNA-binding NarL/FixJ family response regulator